MTPPKNSYSGCATPSNAHWVHYWSRHAARIGCPQLAASLSGWDEQFSVLMRKRIVRHIDSCSTCTEYRRSVVNAVVMLGGGVLNKVS